VLLVDDNQTFRKELRAFLENAEWIEIVAEAEDGMQAVEMWERFKPDVTLMDQHMPLLSGIEAAETILRSDPDSHVFMVVAEEKWRQQALDVGAEGFFVKGVDADALLRTLRKLHDQKLKPIQPCMGWAASTSTAH
jgi:two-component system NarL family response regulator